MAAPYIQARPVDLAEAKAEYDRWLTSPDGKAFGTFLVGKGVALPKPKRVRKKYPYKRKENPLGSRDLARAMVKINDACALEIVELHATGEWSLRALARRYGVAPSTIGYLLRNMNAPVEEGT